MLSSAIKMEKQNPDAINETETWRTISSMNTSRQYFGVTSIRENIYVAGGYNLKNKFLSSCEVYDSKSNKWSPLPDMNEKREGCAVVSVCGKVYAVGGRDDGRFHASCEMFDPATNKWTAIPDMKECRSYCAACAIGDKLYVIGGHAGFYGDYIEYSSAEVFDTVTQEWSSVPNMTTERGGCAAVSVGNKIYVFGVRNRRFKFLSSAEVYDINTQKWTQLPDMKVKRLVCRATAVGNRIYIVGGHDGSFYLSSCEVFDTSTNTWSSPIPDMKENRHGCQSVSIGPKIYVMGGWNGITTLSSLEMCEISMYLLYPTNDNYVTVEGGCRSPKLLENLCIDQICRSLPDLDGDIPPGQPQYLINAIVQSLTSHGALNTTSLKPFRHYKFGQLPSTERKNVVDVAVFESLNGSVPRFSKTLVETNSTYGSRNNGTESHYHKKAKITANDI